MGKPNEDDYVNEGLTEEETAAVAAEASAPEPQEEPQPEAKAEEKPAEKPADEPKTVDLRALQEVRAENREYREKYARLEERTNLILQQLNRQPEPAKDEDTPPNPDEDIFAYAKWQARQIEKLSGKFSEREQHEQQTRQQSEQDRAIAADWNRSVQEFSSQTPDFKDAAGYLANLRVQQLQALGLDQASINATIDNEVKGVVMQARQIGRNPAELIYQYAKASGFTGPKPVEQKNDAEKLRELAETQDRHRSLSDAAGGEAPKPLDAKALAGMSDAAFKKLMDDPKRAAEVDKIMGLA